MFIHSKPLMDISDVEEHGVRFYDGHMTSRPYSLCQKKMGTNFGCHQSQEIAIRTLYQWFIGVLDTYGDDFSKFFMVHSSWDILCKVWRPHCATYIFHPYLSATQIFHLPKPNMMRIETWIARKGHHHPAHGSKFLELWNVQLGNYFFQHIWLDVHLIYWFF